MQSKYIPKNSGQKIIWPTNINYLMLLSAIWLILSGCQKDIPRHEKYDSYEFAGLDTNGGTWIPVLIEKATDIIIDPAADIQSASYQNELQELKMAVANRTVQQEQLIQYWTNNPVLRWNEIALELAAKYNLIPPPNPDGTYTLPSPGNPGGPPPFPFAHPPYTCRMLAYISVAQFDGLISAWHYKYLYKRPLPSEIDSSIDVIYPDTGLPAYPADGAVIAAISRQMLEVFFPLEVVYLEEKYKEHLLCLQLCGLHVKSDIDAGISIGQQISSIALSRAATDGMNRAQTPRPVSDSIKNAAANRFGWFWENMESPQRPVGLVPKFGEVRMWSVPDVELVRAPAPPGFDDPEFKTSTAELKNIANNLTQEQRRIANWWEDGLGSYTPPGHWNKLAKKFCVKYHLNPLRSARVFAYMNMAIMDAGIACWDTKYYYHYPRPIQTIPGFKTILGTPNFPAYTSGHSTFSGAAAEMLSYIFPPESTYCHNWAVEASESRIYGGIHYRFDAEIGVAQGIQTARYTVERAKNDGAD